ncbi:MAG TPA: peptide MFS transporter [Gemmatimonadales bacterium]|nr:peptide MFS transporter [Gemmatimonadales bacterium]
MAAPAPVTSGTANWFGHPRGLSTLFFTEMWERFSYYGMRAFLILYMTASVANGGLGFDDKHAATVYGNYVGSVWLTPILGGLIADRLLGQYRSVLLGGVIIALGHFTLAFKALPSFYLGLVLIVLGTGLLKPNVSTIVGSLYQEGDERRDAGFSMFYMGINLGAFIGPLIAGGLAQKVNWHLGFAMAGIGMVLGLIQYVVGRRHLEPGLVRLAARPKSVSASIDTGAQGLTAEEWKRIAVIFILFIFASVFWGAYEQAGSTLNLFGDRYSNNVVLGFAFPSSWYVSVQAGFVILLSPAFAWLWLKLGSRQPSSPTKFALALVFAALSFLLLVPAGVLAQSGTGVRVSPLWLVGSYFVQELGELCLSPVGLSAVTKLAPVRMVSFMMGVFFLSNSLGNKLAGWTAGFFSSMPLSKLFGAIAVVCLVAAVIMFALIRPVKKLMGGVD